jgi:type II secretory pathway component PulK
MSISAMQIIVFSVDIIRMAPVVTIVLMEGISMDTAEVNVFSAAINQLGQDASTVLTADMNYDDRRSGL